MNLAIKLFLVWISILHFGNTTSIDYSKYALSIDAGVKEFEFGGGNRSTSTSGKPHVQAFHIHSEIRYRYCQTHVISRMGNPNSENSTEATFQIVIPESAFISRFLMEIDGVTYEAYVKEKEQAKQIYNSARESGQTAGLVEINARDSNIFNVNVNIKARAKITFNLTYEELLTRKLGRYEHAININTEEISQIKDFKLTVNIVESQNISILRVPNLRNDLETIQDAEGNNPDVEIHILSGKSANISWTPSERDQIRMVEQGTRGKFIVQYDIDRESDAGEILLMNGYFVHFFVPANVLPLRKHVIFVLDVSGSMSGRKIEQLKSSMLFVLDDLKPDDYFNIITFQTSINLWTPGKHRGIPRRLRRTPTIASEENVRNARKFINNIYPSGGTNINGALLEALEIVKAVSPLPTIPIVRSKRNSYRYFGHRHHQRYSDPINFDTSDSAEDDGETPISRLPSNVESTIVFLTDGEPTVGLTRPESIMNSIKEANKNSVPIFSLAFGTGVNFDFVKKLALQNNGFGRKIYEASDADLQMRGFYREISSPLLRNISFQYTSDNYTVSKLTTRKFPTIFGGSEIAVAGRVIPKKANETRSGIEDFSTTEASVDNNLIPIIAVNIDANGRDGQVTYNHYDVIENDINERKVELTTVLEPTETSTIDVEDVFLERLWAYLTIKQLIDRSVAEENGHYRIEDNDYSGSGESLEEGTNSTNRPTVSKPVETPKAAALRLSLKYGFVTPLTSLVVVKPNDTDGRRSIPTDDTPNLVQALPGSSSKIPPVSSAIGYSIQRNLQMPPASPLISKSTRLRTGGSTGAYGSGGGSLQAQPMMLRTPDPITQRENTMTSHFAMTTDFNQMLESIRQEQERERANFQQNMERRSSQRLLLEQQRLWRQQSPISPLSPVPEASTEKSVTVSTLDDIRWYQRSHNTIVVNETTYTIDKRQFPAKVNSHRCAISQQNSTARAEIGNCKHLSQCVLNEIKTSQSTYLEKYFCALGTFAGICCPNQYSKKTLYMTR